MVTPEVWWLVLFPVILGCLVADSFCGQHDPTQKAKTRPFFSLSSGMMKIYQPKPAALGQTCSSHTRVYELEGHLRHIGVHVSFHVRILRFKKPVWLHEAELQRLGVILHVKVDLWQTGCESYGACEQRVEKIEKSETEKV